MARIQCNYFNSYARSPEAHDVSFKEDLSRVRIGHAAENLGIIRRVALNLLKQEKTSKVGITARRKRAGWDNQYLLKVLMADTHFKKSAA